MSTSTITPVGNTNVRVHLTSLRVNRRKLARAVETLEFFGGSFRHGRTIDGIFSDTLFGVEIIAMPAAIEKFYNTIR